MRNAIEVSIRATNERNDRSLEEEKANLEK
jgi:hypothetical protein